MKDRRRLVRPARRPRQPYRRRAANRVFGSRARYSQAADVQVRRHIRRRGAWQIACGMALKPRSRVYRKAHEKLCRRSRSGTRRRHRVARNRFQSNRLGMLAGQHLVRLHRMKPPPMVVRSTRNIELNGLTGFYPAQRRLRTLAVTKFNAPNAGKPPKFGSRRIQPGQSTAIAAFRSGRLAPDDQPEQVPRSNDRQC